MKLRVYFAAVVALLLSLMLAACIVAPIPSPTRRVGAAGKVKQLDLKAFAPGKTTRDDVSKQLTEVDTGIKLPNAVWARWEKSKWTWVMAVGGPGAATGGGSRFWSADNLFAEFDDAGLLKNWRVVRDDDLGKQLSRFIVAGKRWETDERVELNADHDHRGANGSGSLALHRDYLEFTESGKHAAHSFKVAPTEIAALTTHNLEHMTDEVNVQSIGATLHFRHPIATGNNTLKLMTTTANLVDIVAYLRERAPQAEIR